MDFALTAEQAELKRSARRFLEERCASKLVRAAAEGERGWDVDAWEGARALGWPALLSVGWVEAAVVAEEAGRVLACLPLLSTVLLGANALHAVGQGTELLRRIEEGEATAALAPGPGITARCQTDGSFILSGDAAHVIDGHTADHLLIVASDADAAVDAGATQRDAGRSLFVVEGTAAGVARRKTPTLDTTRAQASLTLRDVRVPAPARVGDSRAVQVTLDRARIALAAESLGGAERCLDMAVDYAKTRVQFDRPIGSFQAIKHRLADMLVAVETARSAAYWAASVAASGELDELPVAAALARSYCTEAFFRCAAECLQIHGGIGFTWEHDAHLFLRRARSSLTLLGTPERDRETIMVQVDAWT
jgi:alkylation response protein AidB-like acyl-CoA dehydrogenase